MSSLKCVTTHTSTRLRYALCNAAGRPVVIAHDPALCLAWYVDMKGCLIFDNETEERYFNSLRREGYTIRRIETAVTIGSEIPTIKQFRSIQREEDKKESQERQYKSTTRSRKTKGTKAPDRKTSDGRPRKAKTRTPRRRAATT